jgi:hypothetical protein
LTAFDEGHTQAVGFREVVVAADVEGFGGREFEACWTFFGWRSAKRKR